jgi:hypothetical protein
LQLNRKARKERKERLAVSILGLRPDPQILARFAIFASLAVKIPV